jgi:hypothetical protein
LDIEHTIIDTIPKPEDDLSGSVPQGAQGSTPNIFVLDFKKDFSIDQEQQYTLSNNSWEVYVGRFVNPHQDGIFLYDRTTGEARVMNFDSKMVVARYQQIHNLPGNWEVHSGDFNGSGRAQLLLYDPGSGDAQFLVLGPDLSLVDQKSFPGWKTGQVLYVGHFGLSSLSVMLYDQKAGQSTFIAFNSSLGVIHQYTISSWSQNSQVLIGSFLDRSRCLATHTCNKGDDILVLNRKTGQVHQYMFSFGNRFKVYDNRSQAFLREGAASTADLKAVDTTSLDLVGTLNTTIHDEELY